MVVVFPKGVLLNVHVGFVERLSELLDFQPIAGCLFGRRSYVHLRLYTLSLKLAVVVSHS